MKKRLIFPLILLITILALTPGCKKQVTPTSTPASDESSQVSKSDVNSTNSVASSESASSSSSVTASSSKSSSAVSSAVKTQAEIIKDTIQAKELFEINFEPYKTKPNGTVSFDFNNDGTVDVLKYSFTKASGTVKEKLKLDINGKIFEKTSLDDYETGFITLGVTDLDTSDGLYELYITDGNLPGISYIYRFNNNDFVAFCNLPRIQAVSGDGKIYYWGGNLYETHGVKFNTDLVLSYYDIKVKDYVKTSQMVGKTLSKNDKVIVFNSKDAVFDGAPMTYDDIIAASTGKIIKIMDANEKFEVLSVADGVQVKTSDGKTGWIGGFHMIWG